MRIRTGYHGRTDRKPIIVPVSQQVQAVADKDAKAKLRQKNRKKNFLEIEFAGLMMNFEDATCYNVSGFCPNADAQKFYVEDVEFRIQGKGGSKTRLRLKPTQPW